MNPKLGKFAASKMIVMQSWEILKSDKEIMWFPVLTSIFSLIALAVSAILYFVLGGTVEASNEVLNYGILFIYYILIFFVINFFEAGLFIIVQARFGGQNLGFMDGVKGAQARFGKILAWSLISATVGIILRIISDKSAMLGKIVTAIFGAAWNILTLFSLPALVIGNVGIKESFKESASIIRKTWGEVIIVNFGVGFFFTILFFGLTMMSIVICIIFPIATVILVVVILLVLSLILLSIISTTLGSIFKLALYNYAKTGQIPQGFSSELIQGAVQAK